VGDVIVVGGSIHRLGGWWILFAHANTTAPTQPTSFGVTPEYLMNARQIEIKMAQGAKPGA
jgi:hypothetical protein